MPKLFIRTHSDLDGVGCELVLKYFLNNRFTKFSVEYHNYNSIDVALKQLVSNRKKAFKKDDLLIISDICPSIETCDLIEKFEIPVMLFDHHITKERVCRKYKWANYNKNSCATQMLLSHFGKDDVKVTERLSEFVKAVQAWDMWETKSKYRKRGENLNTLLHFMGLKEFSGTFFSNIEYDREIIAQEILRYLEITRKNYIDKTIQEQVKRNNIRADGMGRSFIVVFSGQYISELGHAILESDDFSDLAYVVIVNPLKNTVSLRSKRIEVDVSKIAKKIGKGGGHINASGYTFPILGKLENTIIRKFENFRD